MQREPEGGGAFARTVRHHHRRQQHRVQDQDRPAGCGGAADPDAEPHRESAEGDGGVCPGSSGAEQGQPGGHLPRRRPSTFARLVRFGRDQPAAQRRVRVVRTGGQRG